MFIEIVLFLFYSGVLLMGAVSIGAVVHAIIFVVKRVSRRDDPRHTKRPPDTP